MLQRYRIRTFEFVAKTIIPLLFMKQNKTKVKNLSLKRQQILFLLMIR